MRWMEGEMDEGRKGWMDGWKFQIYWYQPQEDYNRKKKIQKKI
jgi:hypothetical protein